MNGWQYYNTWDIGWHWWPNPRPTLSEMRARWREYLDKILSGCAAIKLVCSRGLFAKCFPFIRLHHERQRPRTMTRPCASATTATPDMPLSDHKRKGYASQRSASNGAAITLVAGPGCYIATFECATRCAEVLGNRALQDMGDGLLDYLPTYRIPIEEMFIALGKLSKRFSIALIEYNLEKVGGRFVCLWKIPVEPTTPTTPQPTSLNLDDY